MVTDNLQRQEPADYGGIDRSGGRPRITGPHAGYDRYGRLDHYFYRCERCGLESTDASLADGCWRCEAEDDR
ncbi:hypothetical protein ACFPYI_01270 [Halomarina salina]|uniref:DUF8118 domain-containing protein n=1 Tax=Halomarina salina TaxID=1872699 RepID=A0ABD5RHM0_9EURY|nr:hypothetical protein [Halomarina salina]